MQSVTGLEINLQSKNCKCLVPVFGGKMKCMKNIKVTLLLKTNENDSSYIATDLHISPQELHLSVVKVSRDP